MNNFDLHTPTRILFGKGAIEKLREQIPAEARVLITYGGGSVKKTGVLDQVLTALNGLDVLEFGGIEPNPSYETLMNAVKLAREEKVTFLLAVGGGSVLDGTKFIAAAAHYDADIDPWEILETYGSKIKVFGTEIPHSVRAKEISAEGKSIFAHDPNGKVAEGYKNLTQEVMKLEKQREKSRAGIGR